MLAGDGESGDGGVCCVTALTSVSVTDDWTVADVSDLSCTVGASGIDGNGKVIFRGVPIIAVVERCDDRRLAFAAAATDARNESARRRRRYRRSLSISAQTDWAERRDVMVRRMRAVGIMRAVSYTHLTLPTKRIV